MTWWYMDFLDGLSFGAIGFASLRKVGLYIRRNI